MANPTWFDYEFYMGAKLVQMQKADPAGDWNMSKLVDAFAQNGFVDEDGAYDHFTQFGAAEEVAPNAVNITPPKPRSSTAWNPPL